MPVCYIHFLPKAKLTHEFIQSFIHFWYISMLITQSVHFLVQEKRISNYIFKETSQLRENEFLPLPLKETSATANSYNQIHHHIISIQGYPLNSHRITVRPSQVIGREGFFVCWFRFIANRNRFSCWWPSMKLDFSMPWWNIEKESSF